MTGPEAAPMSLAEREVMWRKLFAEEAAQSLAAHQLFIDLYVVLGLADAELGNNPHDQVLRRLKQRVEEE